MLNLGAAFRYDDSRHAYMLYLPDGQRLTGRYMLLDEASVTGTANIIMAAALAHGDTTIYNAAGEPYLQPLRRLLQVMGVAIEATGRHLSTLNGAGRRQLQ